MINVIELDTISTILHSVTKLDILIDLLIPSFYHSSFFNFIFKQKSSK